MSNRLKIWLRIFAAVSTPFLVILYLNIEKLAEREEWDRILPDLVPAYVSVTWDFIFNPLMVGTGIAVVTFTIGLWAGAAMRRQAAQEFAPAEPAPSGFPSNGVIPTAEPPADDEDEARPREFVEDHITAKYLTDLCRDVTSMEAGKLKAPFVGKWMKVFGYINDIADQEESMTVMLYTEEQAPHPYFAIYADFNDQNCFWRLRQMSRGQKFSVCGKISSIEHFTIRMRTCEIIG